MGKFAFMLHPIDTSDFYRKFPLAAKLPVSLVEQALRRLPPMNISHITGIQSKYNSVEGHFVGCFLTSKQMVTLPEKYVIKKIIRAGKLAERLGAKILGLGAMTSVVGDAGITVARNLNIPVTTGNSYTVATAMEGTKLAASKMGIDLKTAQVVIIGATGSIGGVCAHLMARECKFLTLVARNKEKLSILAENILKNTGLAVKITSNLKEALQKADVIITVTSAVDSVIEPEDLKPGAVVCDVARPRDVSKRVAEVRNDVLVIEGGLVEVPGDVNFNLNFGYPPGLALACMAETMILALEERWENFTLGRDLTLEQVQEISELARKHGFKLAGFRSFEKPVTEEQIAAIKARALLGKKIACQG